MLRAAAGWGRIGIGIGIGIGIRIGIGWRSGSALAIGEVRDHVAGDRAGLARVEPVHAIGAERRA